MTNDKLQLIAHRCLDAAANLDYAHLDDESDEPAYESDPSELATTASIIAETLFPADAAAIAAIIRSFLEID